MTVVTQEKGDQNSKHRFDSGKGEGDMVTKGIS